MRPKKVEPKAPRLAISARRSCISVEAGTRDIVYSVCGDRENPGDAIKRLVGEYQAHRFEKAPRKIQTIPEETTGTKKMLHELPGKSAPTGTRTRV
ncbi:MAG: hypothetical protein LUP97_06675 [Methanoregula sp.]|nr:hypothetical protein [Methanoregula sp.]